MLTWIVESTVLLSILFGALALILLVSWWQTRKRSFAIAAAIAVALIVGLFFLGRAVETDSQRIEKSVREMAAGLEAGDLDRIFAQVAPAFQYHLNDRAEFRRKVTETLNRHDVTGADVWDFSPLEISREKRTGRMEFRVKPRGNWGDQNIHFRCVADYVLDPDDKWRLRGFQIFHAVGTQELPVPGY